MTSKIITDSVMNGYKPNFPLEGRNNPSQPFRDNFSITKNAIDIAAEELGILHTKRISIIGDATGTSGQLGRSSTQPDPISLVLASTGVTAGTYSSANNNLEIIVDSKGRITGFTSVAIPTNSDLDDTFVGDATLNPSGHVSSLVLPSLTFDEYGKLVDADSDALTLEFGLTGHELTRGSLVVGNSNGESEVLPLPTIGFNPNDLYALVWRNTSPNGMGMEWVQIPPPPPVNPARLIEVRAGPGIQVDSDVERPTLALDLTTLPAFPTTQAITNDAQLVVWDPATNTDYRVDASRISQVGATPPGIMSVNDDPAPELGGNLFVGGRTIYGGAIAGITLEVPDAGRIRLRHIDNSNPSSPAASDQSFPLRAPLFTPEEIQEGISSAVMKIGPGGLMFWDKNQDAEQGVTEVNAGPGIGISPVGSITSTGSVSLDFASLPLVIPDIYSDHIAVQSAGLDIYRQTISALTLTLPNVTAVDPVYGLDDTSLGRGQLNTPFRTITAAIDSVTDSIAQNNYILLFPGSYNEDVVINKSNIQLHSLMGPDMTTLRGGITIQAVNPGRNVLKGINLDMANIIGRPSPERLLTAVDGIGKLLVEDCYFYRDTDDNDRLMSIIMLAGTQQDSVIFDGCKFNGILTNSLLYDIENGYSDGNVIIRNTVGNERNMLTVATTANTLTKIYNADYMCQVRHTGGVVELKNIGAMVGDFTDAEWSALPPGQDLETNGVIPSAVISTANVSQRNLLVMSNVSLGYVGDFVDYKISRINKTGTCAYSLSNVDRMSNVDTVMGNRYRYAGAPGTDSSETVNTVASVTGSFNARISASRTWDLTLSGNATVNIQEDSYATDMYIPNTFANSITFLVRQGSSDYTVGFNAPGGIIWSDGSGQPPMTSGAGNISVYTFLRVGSTWMGSRTFNQV